MKNAITFFFDKLQKQLTFMSPPPPPHTHHDGNTRTSVHQTLQLLNHHSNFFNRKTYLIASLRAGHFQLLGNQLTHSATAEATLSLPLCSVSEHLAKPNTKGPLFHRQREKVHRVRWPQESLLLSPMPALSFAPAEVARPQPKAAVPRLCCSPQARIGSTSSHP